MTKENKEKSYNSTKETKTLIRKNFFGLRFKMFIYFGLVFVLSIIIMEFLEFYGSSFLGIEGEYDIKRSVMFKQLNLIADLKKERLNRWLRDILSDARIITENDIITSNIGLVNQLFYKNFALTDSQPELLEALQKEDVYKHLAQFLEGIKKYGPVYNTAQIVNIKSGVIIASSENTNIGTTISNNFYEKMLVSGGKGFFTVKESSSNSSYNLYFSRNIETGSMLSKNGASNKDLFLVMSINARDFALPVMHTGHGLGKTGEAFLVDKEVRILTPIKHPLKDGTIAKPFEQKIEDQPAILSTLGFEGILESKDYRGELVLAAFRHIVINTDMTWGLIVKQDTKEIFAILYDGIKNSIIICLVGIVVIFFVTIILANKLSKPINILTDTAYKVSSGDLKARASLSNKDDIGFLATTFNAMIDSVENWRNNLESKVQERTKELTISNNALKASEDKYHDLYDNAPDMLLSVDPKSAKIISCNNTLVKSSGYSKAEIKEMTIFDIYHPHCLEEAQKGFQKSIEKGEITDLELLLKCKNNSTIEVSLNASSVRDNQGNIVASRSALRDITRHKTLERNLAKSNEQLLHSEKLAAIGKLSASIAHEFNNPICGIKNVLETIKDSTLDNDEKRLLGLAIKECHRMADLINKLKDFNRPTSGVMCPVNLHEIIDDILLFIRKKLDEREIGIEKNYAEQLPSIKAVHDQVKQVFLNLIQNAEEAIVKDSGKIIITTDCINDEVLIHIKDTGVGIPPQDMNLIFEPFFTSKPAVKGTGLGLSVCHGILKKFGGNIKVDSQIGNGATFTVIFPIEQESVAQINTV